MRDNFFCFFDSESKLSFFPLHPSIIIQAMHQTHLSLHPVPLQLAVRVLKLLVLLSNSALFSQISLKFGDKGSR